jgi:hypothetical protein
LQEKVVMNRRRFVQSGVLLAFPALATAPTNPKNLPTPSTLFSSIWCLGAALGYLLFLA